MLPRALSRTGTALLVVLAAGCALLVPQSPLGPSPGAPAAAKLRAGAARLALTPVDHEVSLAGFGPHPERASDVNRLPDGTPLDLHVRALSLSTGRELAPGVDRVVIVVLDALIVTRAVRRAIVDRLGLARTEVV